MGGNWRTGGSEENRWNFTQIETRDQTRTLQHSWSLSSKISELCPRMGEEKEGSESVQIRCTHVVKSINGINLFFLFIPFQCQYSARFHILFRQLADCLRSFLLRQTDTLALQLILTLPKLRSYKIKARKVEICSLKLCFKTFSTSYSSSHFLTRLCEQCYFEVDPVD